MAASMTFTYDKNGPVKRILVDWTSDASGDTAGTTVKVCGKLLKGVTDPQAVAPTDNYDIVITDEEGLDVLGVCQDDLVDRDTANSEQVYFLLKNFDATPIGIALPPCVCDKLTITVANAGNGKSGQLILYVEGDIYSS